MLGILVEGGRKTVKIKLLNSVITGRIAAKRQTAGIKFTHRPKIRFSPRRGDSLHQFRSNFSWPTGTWVRLSVQNFTSIGADGWECGPKVSKIYTFW